MPEEPRLVELLFAAHAKAIAARKAHGDRSDEYTGALEGVAELRRLRDDERLCR
jgi:hypothetical protein